MTALTRANLASPASRPSPLPAALLVAAAIWSTTIHVLWPTLLPEHVQGVMELMFALVAGLVVLVSTVRSDNERVARAAAMADVHALETSLADVARERRLIARRIATLSSGQTPEETAAAICAQLTSLPGVDFAALNVFEGEHDVVTLGMSGVSFPVGLRLPPDRARGIRARARLGGWSERWIEEAGDGEFGRAVTAAGVKAVAIGPIGNGHGPVGILLVGATSEGNAEHIVERLPALVEFASAAQGLIGPALLARREQVAIRDRVSEVIRTRAFKPVFQPVVEIESGRRIGFEALTRFDDGASTDATFSTALGTGLGPALEAATLRAAVAGAVALPDGAWLGLNVSPAFALTRQFADIASSVHRPIVIEITEHEPIADYGALRRAIAAIGPDVRVAVDDAGAGVANFGHIVDLDADFVKLDVSLTRNVDSDPTRQALVVGLLHFAAATGHEVIAEGIERPEELATLRALGVRLAQGYLLGVPRGPADLVVRHRPVATDGFIGQVAALATRQAATAV